MPGRLLCGTRYSFRVCRSALTQHSRLHGLKGSCSTAACFWFSPRPMLSVSGVSPRLGAPLSLFGAQSARSVDVGNLCVGPIHVTRHLCAWRRSPVSFCEAGAFA